MLGRPDPSTRGDEPGLPSRLRTTREVRGTGVESGGCEERSGSPEVVGFPSPDRSPAVGHPCLRTHVGIVPSDDSKDLVFEDVSLYGDSESFGRQVYVGFLLRDDL